MATGGSYNPSTFAQKTPFETWAGVQGIGLYWDTENQFAAGKQGVTRASFGGPGAVSGSLQRATPPGGNYLGGYGQRQINIGERNYGSQAIDRGELARLGTGVAAVYNEVEGLAGTVGTELSNKRQYKKLQKQGIGLPPGAPGTGSSVLPPPPPGAGAKLPAPGTITQQATPSGPTIPPPPPGVPLPSPNINQPSGPGFLPPGVQPPIPAPPGGPGTPGVMPPPAPGAGAPASLSARPNPRGGPTSSQRLQRAMDMRAQRDAERAGVMPGAPSVTPAPGTRAARRPSGLGPAGKAIFAGLRGENAPAPTSAVGDQNARLAAEGGVQPPQKRKK